MVDNSLILHIDNINTSTTPTTAFPKLHHLRFFHKRITKQIFSEMHLWSEISPCVDDNSKSTSVTTFGSNFGSVWHCLHFIWSHWTTFPDIGIKKLRPDITFNLQYVAAVMSLSSWCSGKRLAFQSQGSGFYIQNQFHIVKRSRKINKYTLWWTIRGLY